MLSKFKIFLDARLAFAALFDAIKESQKHVHINSFIWRNDVIGRNLLTALEAAAKRGISVHIQKDRGGWLFERSEENGSSLFHPTDWRLLPVARFLNAAYYPCWVKEPAPPPSELPWILAHPKLELVSGRNSDHSKFVIVDDRILFLGGLNIEDRFISRSSLGQNWQDLFIRILDQNIVSQFIERLYGGTPGLGPIDFILNDPSGHPKRRFEWKARVLDVLNVATRSLTIAVAYHGDKEVMAALGKCLQRGVAITMLFSEYSNMQHQLNLQCARRLYDQGAHIHLWPGMFHGKALIIDDVAILGSANLNRSSSCMGETDLFVENKGEGEPLYSAIKSAVNCLVSQGRRAERLDLGRFSLRQLLESNLSKFQPRG